MSNNNKNPKLQEIVDKLFTTESMPTTEELTEEKCPKCNSYLYKQYYYWQFFDYLYLKCKDCGYKKELWYSINDFIFAEKPKMRCENLSKLISDKKE